MNDNDINNSAPPHSTVIAITTISQAEMDCLFFTIFILSVKRNLNPHSLNLCNYKINFLSIFRALKAKVLHYFRGSLYYLETMCYI